MATDASTALLASLATGARARVRQLIGAGPLRRRLMDLGAIPGQELVVEAVAPLGDPIEISIKGYRLSLRRSEAALVVVEVLR